MFVHGMRTAFPDLRLEVIGQYQDSDIHIGHLRSSGTGVWPTRSGCCNSSASFRRPVDSRCRYPWRRVSLPGSADDGHTNTLDLGVGVRERWFGW